MRDSIIEVEDFGPTCRAIECARAWLSLIQDPEVRWGCDRVDFEAERTNTMVAVLSPAVHRPGLAARAVLLTLLAVVFSRSRSGQRMHPPPVRTWWTSRS